MKLKIDPRPALVLCTVIFSSSLVAQQQPLRIFIRSSDKTHGAADNGSHDYPAFRNSWTKLLGERGAIVSGGERFPSADELAKTDVLINYSSDGANHTPEERALLERYVKGGGGVVVIHDGMCGKDPLWYASVIGGAKQHGERNSSHSVMKFHIDDAASPIVKGISDFDFDDELFFLLRAEGLAPGADGKPTMWTYGLKVSPDIHVLATTKDPQGNIVPQLWTYEHTAPGGKPYRAFVTLEGHSAASFNVPQYQTILLRGIAWAGKHPVDELLSGGGNVKR
jgi:type 1 glutamine amidotransferase